MCGRSHTVSIFLEPETDELRLGSWILSSASSVARVQHPRSITWAGHDFRRRRIQAEQVSCGETVLSGLHAIQHLPRLSSRLQHLKVQGRALAGMGA